jgi:hypothetical protein
MSAPVTSSVVTAPMLWPDMARKSPMCSEKTLSDAKLWMRSMRAWISWGRYTADSTSMLVPVRKVLSMWSGEKTIQPCEAQCSVRK